MVEVVAEGGGVAVAQGEGGVGFCGVGEPHDFVESGGAVAGDDVAEDAAGRDGVELLVVADEPDAGAALDRPTDQVVQAQCVGHAGLVDDDQRVRINLVHPIGGSGLGDLVGQLVQGVGVDALAEFLAELGGDGRGRGEGEHIAAAVAPGGG